MASDLSSCGGDDLSSLHASCSPATNAAVALATIFMAAPASCASCASRFSWRAPGICFASFPGSLLAPRPLGIFASRRRRRAPSLASRRRRLPAVVAAIPTWHLRRRQIVVLGAARERAVLLHRRRCASDARVRPATGEHASCEALQAFAAFPICAHAMCHQCLKCSVAVGVALTKLVGAPTANLLLEAEPSTCGGRMSGLMKVKDAAKFLALSESMVRKLLTRNELTAVRIGRSVRVRLQDLEALVARGVRDSGG